MEPFATVMCLDYNACGYELNIKSVKLYLIYDVILYVYKFCSSSKWLKLLT